jgi:hypothetical protein
MCGGARTIADSGQFVAGLSIQTRDSGRKMWGRKMDARPAGAPLQFETPFFCPLCFCLSLHRILADGDWHRRPSEKSLFPRVALVQAKKETQEH